MKKTKKVKIIVEGSILDKIANSVILSEEEKYSFFRLVNFMTKSEQKELATLI